MIELNGQILHELPMSGMAKVHDLDYQDGPLLSQFRDDQQNQYLSYWCDCDEATHRWMLLSIDEEVVARLVGGKIPLDEVIPHSCKDAFVYFVESGEKDRPETIVRVQLADIPEDYKPAKGAYLDTPAQDQIRNQKPKIENQEYSSIA